ncbi:hypothetical protein GCM10008015_15230 [Flavobacterium palustre]|uniref:Uncharacterized protein n=1 Tax=Flavobacterium palustre TaxID=1476463 RepID=A0ABQ1HFL5_9FLAO|nr:hypothetical protein GCM10008015_15230 [Flavobacterium palustre]
MLELIVEKTVSKKTVSLEKANFPELGTVEKSERQEQIVIRIVKIKSSEKGRMIFVFW